MKDLRQTIDSLALPVVVAPMTGVSGPELASAACVAGVIGSFPAHNTASHEELGIWLSEVESARRRATESGLSPGPFALNIVMRQRSRLEGDLRVAIEQRVPIVIASVGSPAEIIPPLHDAGIHVFADVASMRHVEKCLEAGVDGLVLLTAGAGGNTGWVNPFAFVRAVRAVYDGPLALAGGVTDGASLRAAVTLGCDLALMGTAFIATTEARAGDDYKAAVVAASLDRVIAVRGPEGITASMISDTHWTAGHSVSGVRGICSIGDLLARIKREWKALGGPHPPAPSPA